MKKEQLTAVELFAGIGGFHLGLAGANIETIWANDLNELCCKVYQSNFHKDSITLGDINEIPKLLLSFILLPIHWNASNKVKL